MRKRLLVESHRPQMEPNGHLANQFWHCLDTATGHDSCPTAPNAERYYTQKMTHTNTTAEDSSYSQRPHYFSSHRPFELNYPSMPLFHKSSNFSPLPWQPASTSLFGRHGACTEQLLKKDDKPPKTIKENTAYLAAPMHVTHIPTFRQLEWKWNADTDEERSRRLHSTSDNNKTFPTDIPRSHQAFASQTRYIPFKTEEFSRPKTNYSNKTVCWEGHTETSLKPTHLVCRCSLKSVVGDFHGQPYEKPEHPATTKSTFSNETREDKTDGNNEKETKIKQESTNCHDDKNHGKSLSTATNDEENSRHYHESNDSSTIKSSSLENTDKDGSVRAHSTLEPTKFYFPHADELYIDPRRGRQESKGDALNSPSVPTSSTMTGDNTIQKGNKHTCDECGRTFTRSSTLVTHKRIHSGDKPFSCELCGRAFRQPGNLSRHRLTHTTTKPYVCPHCNKAFNRASNLHTHMRTHSDYKPYKCDFCDKRFHQKVDMKIHRYTHTGEKPHKCLKCGRGFKQLTHLTYHMRTHSDVRMYQCEFCDKGFNQKGNLQAHRYRHTGERPFKCNVCGKGFTLASTRNTHLRTHAEKKPFECQYCDKAFYQKNALKTHYIASHPYSGGVLIL